MEDALAQYGNSVCFHMQGVLILVVMEDALAHNQRVAFESVSHGLNPCCNGRCTRTANLVLFIEKDNLVLILVVMEDALALYYSSR